MRAYRDIRDASRDKERAKHLQEEQRELLSRVATYRVENGLL